MTDMLIIIISVLVAAGGFLWRRFLVRRIHRQESPTKGRLRLKKLSVLVIVAGAYVLITTVIGLLFGNPESGKIEVEIVAPRVSVLGMSLSTTVIYSWGIMAVLILIALVLRLTVIPKFKDVPKGVQNVIELAVETALKYTKSTAHGVGEFLASYIFTIALFLVGCAVTELLGLRTPAADITLTGSLAILTFLFINIYGIKVKGVGGRLKSLASPTPIILPIRLITDLAIPVSLACRLFGNMLGGLVVMELIYTALGNYAVGLPSLLGLYFNVFHPLIQAFIFITLTLTFTNEATELEENS